MAGIKIAVSGKGGVGKTSVSASLALAYSVAGHRVYAIDADPDANLGLALGIPDEILEGVQPLIEMKALIAERTGEGALYRLNPDVDDILDDYSTKIENIRLLRMGGLKSGGSQCYCKENSFLQAVVTSLLLGEHDVVIMDMSAGIEHLTRGTSQGVDVMVVVTEPSRASVQTTRSVLKLCDDLGISCCRVVGNKIRTQNEEQFIRDNFEPSLVLGCLPFDEQVASISMDGAPVDGGSMDGGGSEAGIRSTRLYAAVARLIIPALSAVC